MSTYNLRFYRELTKIILQLPSNTHLNYSRLLCFCNLNMRIMKVTMWAMQTYSMKEGSKYISKTQFQNGQTEKIGTSLNIVYPKISSKIYNKFSIIMHEKNFF